MCVPRTASVIPEILLLIEQIRPRTPQIDNLWTPIPIFLQPRALEAVKRIADALAAADDAFVLVVPEGALVADAGKRSGTNVGVAYGALAVAFVAEPADGDARCFAAHDEIGMMARHGDLLAMEGGYEAVTFEELFQTSGAVC